MNQLRQATAAVEAEMRQLREQLARARRERDSARHQRDLATNQGDIARAEAASAVDALGAMRGERDRFRSAYAEATAKTSRLESLLHRFTAQTELESRLHATRRSLSEAVAKVDWLEARLGESAPDASADDERCLNNDADEPLEKCRRVGRSYTAKRTTGAPLRWSAQADTAWRLALEFASPVAAGRVAVVCRAAARGAMDELLWSVFAARAGVGRSLTTKHLSGNALTSRAAVVAACPDVDVADAVSGRVATITGAGRGSRRHYERTRSAILWRVRELEVELSHDEILGSRDDDATLDGAIDLELYDFKGYWDDEREPLFRELHYLLEWLEREDRLHGRMDRALDWKTHVSPPEGMRVRVADHDRHDMHDGSLWARYLKQLKNRGGELPDNRGSCRSEPCSRYYRCDSSVCACSSPALETDLRWCAVEIHGDALYYDRLILATPAIGPGDRVLALAPDARRRLACCDGSVPPPNYMRPAVVKSIDAAGSYMLTFDRSAPPSARAAFRDFVYGRVAVLTVHKFKGYDDDDEDSLVESGWVKETYLYRSARRAIAACLEIAEADAHRCPPDEPEYLWTRYRAADAVSAAEKSEFYVIHGGDGFANPRNGSR